MLSTKEELWVKQQVMAEGRGNPTAPADFNERVDAAVDSVLRAAGSSLKNHTMQLTLDRLRSAMREIMSESYIAGSNAARRAMVEAKAMQQPANQQKS